MQKTSDCEYTSVADPENPQTSSNSQSPKSPVSRWVALGLGLLGVVVVVIAAIAFIDSSSPKSSISTSSKFSLGAPRAPSTTVARQQPQQHAFTPTNPVRTTRPSLLRPFRSFFGQQDPTPQLEEDAPTTAAPTFPSRSSMLARVGSSVGNFVQRVKHGRRPLPQASKSLSSTVYPLSDNREHTISVPGAFETNGLLFRISVDQSSCTLDQDVNNLFQACYTTTVDDTDVDVVGKFASSQFVDATTDSTNNNKDGLSLVDNEAHVLGLLERANVPRVVPILAYSAVDDNLHAVLLAKAAGEPVSSNAGLWLSLADPTLDQQAVPSNILENEKVMIQESLETAVAMLHAGVATIVPDQSILVDKESGHVTFVNLGRADILTNVNPSFAVFAVMYMFEQIFTNIPQRQSKWVTAYLTDLLRQYSPPQTYSSESSILGLWQQRSRPMFVGHTWVEADSWRNPNADPTMQWGDGI